MEESGIFGCVTLLCFIALFVGLGFSLSKVGPSAMDVYQGKTILEYTIIDGVKIDSCVIWKNKEE